MTVRGRVPTAAHAGRLRVARVAAGVPVLTGGLALVGHLADVEVLATWAPGLAPMRANTAVALILLGLAAWLTLANAPRGLGATALAAIAAAIGAATLAEYATGADLGIDQALLRDSFAGGLGYAPGRMAPTTAAAFVLAGAALVAAGTSRTSRRFVFAPLAIVALIATISLIGYVYSVHDPLSTRAIPMALNTATAFLALAVAITFSFGQGHAFESLFRRDAIGAASRRLLALAFALPLVVGLVAVTALRTGLANLDQAATAAVTALIVVLALVFARTWSRLAVATDLQANETRRAAESAEALDRLFDASPIAKMITRRNGGQILRGNRQLAGLVGQPLEAVVGRTGAEIGFHGASVAEEFQVAASEPSHAPPGGIPLTVRRPDGTTREVRSYPVTVPYAGDLAVYAAIVDVTEEQAAHRALQAAEAALRQLNRELEGRVEERTAALVAAVQELEAFGYSVSHDLRTPLRAIDGFSKILEDEAGEELSEASRGHLTRIRQSSRRMATLIDDLLRFSRLGRQEVARQPIDMDALVGEVVADILVGHPEVRAAIQVDRLPAAQGDPALVRQVLVNLVENAVKFSANGAEPHVAIGHEPTADGDVYFVRDNGVGFDMAFADTLFGVFQRLHRTEEFPGTGVGLAMVRRIVERHGGRVWAEAAEGKGATFRFTLGCAPADPDGQRAVAPLPRRRERVPTPR